MNNSPANFERRLDLLTKTSTGRQLAIQRRRFRMSDREVIPVLTVEYISVLTASTIIRRKAK